jgi:hypothetical protein
MDGLGHIYKNRWFARWARKNGLSDDMLVLAVQEMKRGLVDADLGGGLFKKRIGRAGTGKSGGYRTLLATNRKDRWVFIFGFAKNTRSNITTVEMIALRKLTSHLLALTSKQIYQLQAAEELQEVSHHDDL